ncbi:amidase signature domain-containing protein [Cercophora scortea]|uniref:Amidase signature domain-containing protein n=1 Tax=Cercophora scortea TaxID=314031 RepID=A0AAE0IW61_9PEZI|nr:amidase signature domain-containing protein [Cercophora scortea]
MDEYHAKKRIKVEDDAGVSIEVKGAETPPEVPEEGQQWVDDGLEIQHQPRTFFMIHDRQYYSDIHRWVSGRPLKGYTVERPVKAFDGVDPGLDPWLRSLATVFNFPQPTEITTGELLDTVQRWLNFDDVFLPNFLHTVYFSVDSMDDMTMEDLDALVPKEWCTRYIKVLKRPSNSPAPTRPGPYEMLAKNRLSPVYRVYPDIYRAFATPIIQMGTRWSRFAIPKVDGIPVPSRIPFGSPSGESPLAGKRVVVTDDMDLRALATGRRSADLSGNDERRWTAPIILRLINAGAVVIGRTKIAPVASGRVPESPAGYEAPINPRGDGLQAPGGRNAGGATACSAYKWVDIALGINTTGEVITPAVAHGLFGFRLSFDRVPMDGIVPVSPELDAVGILTRSARDAAITIRALNADNPLPQFQPSNGTLWFVRPNFEAYGHGYATANAAWAEDFCKLFKMKRYDRSIEGDLCAAMNNVQSLEWYMDNIPTLIQAYQSSQNIKRLSSRYMEGMARLTVSKPLESETQNLHAKASRVVSDRERRYKNALSMKKLLTDWTQSHVFTSRAEDKYFKQILLTPTGYRVHYYRKSAHEPDVCPMCKQEGDGLWNKVRPNNRDLQLAVLAGLPIMNIPCGETQFMSHVTGEYVTIPASVAIIGPLGSDVVLSEMVAEFLEQVQRGRAAVETVETGPRIFPLRSQEETGPPAQN